MKELPKTYFAGKALPEPPSSHVSLKIDLLFAIANAPMDVDIL
jgi:hypothetical protein